MKKIIWLEEEVNLLGYLYEENGLSYNETTINLNKRFHNNRSIESVRIKIKRLKLKHSEEQTFKIKSKNVSGDKNPMYGKVSINNGLTKENSERIRLSSDKLSLKRKQMFKDGLLPIMSGDKNPMYGKIPWCFGLTKYTDERILKGCIKISESKKLLWKSKTESEKKVIIDRLNDAMIHQHKATRIEIKVGDYLSLEKISFIKNYKLNGFYIDFYLTDYNIALECDGDWWHVNPLFYNREDNNALSIAQKMTIKRDLRKNKMFEDNSIDYLRFWEIDIHKNFEEVKHKIKILIKRI